MAKPQAKQRKLPPAEPVGRPSKFNPEICASIIKAIHDGMPYSITAEANGISERTLYDWIELGKKHLSERIDSDYAKFSQTVKQAEFSKMHYHINEIKQKPERWQADAWILERRWWKHFSPSAAVLEFEKRLKRMEDEDKGESDGDAEGSKEK